jgi:hypothetical protein
MSFIRSYIENDLEITQYTGGGSVRDNLTGEIVGSYTDYWTEDGTIHPTTQEEIELLERKLGVKIKCTW